ncbi:hypothetical protein TSOC_005430 [Tetrabaena socialis]|uniref:Uncharacterized protein n=1 Tax=Tetrabaena socialis TaxID=47790 RepID=A0A2J8A688_9CHLO|nr:hypothetical protein TSOC_005430 [Tetrabaena socialis]|eukprot:PNH08044.1 hypothetical protein TSOC_005430 [Tetrabaena socialis]
MSSRGVLVFGGACGLAAATIYYVHHTEGETRSRMKQGPKRDRERLEAQTDQLFKEALSEWRENAAQQPTDRG